MIWRHLLPSGGCLHFLGGVLCRTESSSSSSPAAPVLLGAHLRGLCLSQGHEGTLPCCLLRALQFQRLHLDLGSILTFVYGVKGPKYIPCTWHPVVPAPGVGKMTRFPPAVAAKSEMDRRRTSVSFRMRSPISRVCMPTLMMVTQSLPYCSLVVSSEIRKCERFEVVLFHDCFGYSGSLAFP